MLRDSAQGYLGDAGGAPHARRVRALSDGFDPATWASFGELGWTGVLLPERLGGSELGLEPALTLAEELGRSIAPEPFVASSVIAGTLLSAATTDAATELGIALAQGRRSVTLAWQENRGSLGLPPFVTCLQNGMLSGTKVHVPGWHPGVALLVAAVSATGPVVVLVDPTAAGVTITASRLTDATLAADIVFDRVAIADDAVLLRGAAAEAALQLALARGTVALSAQLEGLAGALWQMTASYMKDRLQFGSRLSDFQALRHQMVDLSAGIELAAASWRAAATALDSGVGVDLAIHAAKARCSQAAQDMSRWAIQYHGAFGYTDEADVGLFVHAALAWSTWLGNPAAHRRAALVAYRSGNVRHG
ncbi:acyl-CoA dehydrogenase family protein [Novosphingobium cyanobacteriorum]